MHLEVPQQQLTDTQRRRRQRLCHRRLSSTAAPCCLSSIARPKAAWATLTDCFCKSMVQPLVHIQLREEACAVRKS